MTEADFALAREAAAAVSESDARRFQRLVVDAELPRDLAAQVRRQLLVRRRRGALQAQAGRCTMACRDALEHLALRLFVDVDATVGVDDPRQVTRAGVEAALVTGRAIRLHACSRESCGGAGVPGLHVRDATEALARAGLVAARPLTEGGGAHWCPAHTRMHVCSAHCRQGVSDSLGFRVCVLSGRTIGASMRQQFGHGTRVLSAEGQHRSEVARRERREEHALRRSATAAVENVVRAGNSHAIDRSPEAPPPTKRARGTLRSARRVFELAPRPREGQGGEEEVREEGGDSRADAAADDDLYVDVDVPADDLFGDTLEQNTFGDGVGGALARAYTQTYATAYLLIFSDKRADYERSVREAVVAEAQARIASYVANKSKPDQFVSLPVCRQLELRELNARRHLPVMVVPENAPERLTAYYALVVMEFYLQLLQIVDSMLPELTGALHTIGERFMAADLATIAPNVLDLMHEGLAVDGQTIIDAEALLVIFPEIQTMSAIGLDTKRCTESKKMLKQLVVAAMQRNQPLRELATTRIDSFAVLFGRQSIVSTFLAARRRRLGLDDE